MNVGVGIGVDYNNVAADVDLAYDNLELENGEDLLQENGDLILLEG